MLGSLPAVGPPAPLVPGLPTVNASAAFFSVILCRALLGHLEDGGRGRAGTLPTPTGWVQRPYSKPYPPPSTSHPSSSQGPRLTSPL